jgi:hypothetical protein
MRQLLQRQQQRLAELKMKVLEGKFPTEQQQQQQEEEHAENKQPRGITLESVPEEGPETALPKRSGRGQSGATAVSSDKSTLSVASSVGSRNSNSGGSGNSDGNGPSGSSRSAYMSSRVVAPARVGLPEQQAYWARYTDLEVLELAERILTSDVSRRMLRQLTRPSLIELLSAQVALDLEVPADAQKEYHNEGARLWSAGDISERGAPGGDAGDAAGVVDPFRLLPCGEGGTPGLATPPVVPLSPKGVTWYKTVLVAG